MTNPWTTLPFDQFLLPGDAPFVYASNLTANPQHYLHTNLPPIPFIGDPRTADVIVLAKNPGYAGTEQAELLSYPALALETRDALTFSSFYPFFFLDPRFRGSAGFNWWERNLSEIFNACERTQLCRRDVLSRIACVEWFPYHSARFKPLPQIMPSQQYSFWLVKQAAARGAVFVILFGTFNERLWRQNVPSLPKNCIRLNSMQTTRLSRTNMAITDFDRIIGKLVG